MYILDCEVITFSMFTLDVYVGDLIKDREKPIIEVAQRQNKTTCSLHSLLHEATNVCRKVEESDIC